MITVFGDIVYYLGGFFEIDRAAGIDLDAQLGGLFDRVREEYVYPGIPP